MRSLSRRDFLEFALDGSPINAASILPGLLQRFGDVAQVLAEIAPRRILVASGAGPGSRANRSVQAVPGRFSADSRVLTEWIGD